MCIRALLFLSVLLAARSLACGGASTPAPPAVQTVAVQTGTWHMGNGGPDLVSANASATLLPSGKVRVAGGWNGDLLASAELYDPTAGTWSATGSLEASRMFQGATPLGDGTVMVSFGAVGVWSRRYTGLSTVGICSLPYVSASLMRARIIPTMLPTTAPFSRMY
jgi:hypothetical protein